MKKIIITEEQERALINILSNDELNNKVQQMPVPKKANKPFCINPDNVLIVKNFLDKNFTKGNLEGIGNNGMPSKTRIVSTFASNGEALKSLYDEDLLDLLIHRYKDMFLDKEERYCFLKQVMNDWFDNKISPLGFLSVNRLVRENKNHINEITSDEIAKEGKKVNLNPTDLQKEAGNYSMGHISVKGMKISIENPKGSKRYWKNEKGETGFNIMHNDYGYFNLSKGKDGDMVDVFIGPHIEDFERVYCIDQNNKQGEFDETKVMLGFISKKEAKEAYLSNYSKGWKGFRSITSVGLKTFKKWLYRGRKQRQPFSDYVEIKKKELKESKNA